MIRWTLAHRKQYTSNPHWFLVGDSAGAQLVSQYCILAGNAAYREQLDFATYDQLPDGTALNCGIYDMSLENIHKNIYTQEAAPEQQKLFEQVLTYMNSSFPPSYLMASVNDGCVPAQRRCGSGWKHAGYRSPLRNTARAYRQTATYST